MADTTFIKSELRKALDSLMEMASDTELAVLGGRDRPSVTQGGVFAWGPSVWIRR